MRVLQAALDQLEVLGTGRSPKWPAARRKHLRENPRCVVTGLPAEEVHHVESFKDRPDLELEPSNFRSVTRDAHLIVGHGGDWKKIVTDFDEVAKRIRVSRR